jgi:excisionase family DNA binding protein
MTLPQDGSGGAGGGASRGYDSSRAASVSAVEVRVDDRSDGETTILLTAAQLAERWQVPVRTIYAWAKRNEIPHYRAGRLLRFAPDEVENHFRRAGYADELIADDEHPGESAFALLTA